MEEEEEEEEHETCTKLKRPPLREGPNFILKYGLFLLTDLILGHRAIIKIVWGANGSFYTPCQPNR